MKTTVVFLGTFYTGAVFGYEPEPHHSCLPTTLMLHAPTPCGMTLRTLQLPP